MTLTQPAPRSQADLWREVLDIIQSHKPAGDYTVAGVCDAAMLDLMANHPLLWDDFAQTLIRTQIQEVLRGEINHARGVLYRQAKPKAFAAAHAAFEETGDPGVFGAILDTTHIIDRLNTRRAMRDMTANDCTFVAEHHEDKARTHQMRAAFWKAIAKRIGNRTIGDVFNEAQIAAIYNQMTH